MRKLLFILLISLTTMAFSATNSSVPISPGVKSLFLLMKKRAALMRDVAAIKFINKQSPYDSKQENKVLLDCATIANNYKIDAPSLQVFSQIQMDLSKQIESYWINYWTTKGVEPHVKYDLTTIRNKIAKIDTKLYFMIIQNLPALKNSANYPFYQQKISQIMSFKSLPVNPSYPKLLLSALTAIK